MIKLFLHSNLNRYYLNERDFNLKHTIIEHLISHTGKFQKTKPIKFNIKYILLL